MTLTKKIIPKYSYGWKPSGPDLGDVEHAFVPKIKKPKLPPSVDMRPQCPPIYNQTTLGSCTANASGAAFEFTLLKLKLADFMPSRLFIYYGERAIEGTVKTDAGANLRDALKVLSKLGVCDETIWPYDVSKFSAKPSAAAFKAALANKATAYHAVAQNPPAIMSALAQGFPVIFGFTVYESFESPQVAKTGVVPMPQPGEQVLGGHAVLAVGYLTQNNTLYAIVRNSWGTGWGLSGYFLMPMDYITNPNLADDFWVITKES